MSTPLNNKKYEIQVRIADQEWTLVDKECEPKGRYNKVNKLVDDVVQFPYININDIGTVFVYLMYNNKRVCFYKADIASFTNLNPSLQWVEMEPDLSIGQVKEHYNASIVGFKLSIHDQSSNGAIDWKDYPAWQKPKRHWDIIKIRVFCWQARDLPAGDDTGSSDPFIQITDCDKVQSTNVIYENLNPLFYQAIDTEYEAKTIEEMPPIVLDVYDNDTNMMKSDTQDFLARALLFVHDLNYSQDNTIFKPEWHNLYFKKGGPASGQVLLSFAVVSCDFKFKTELKKLKLESQVKMKEFAVSLNILGLRGLQSSGLMPVKKAFMSFNLKSLVAPKLGKNLENIRTEPKMAGSNPTLNMLIQFKAFLPIEILFCPLLSCSVFDSIFMGASQPQIGTFLIPIGELMHDKIKQRTAEIDALEDVVQQLKKFVNGEMIVSSLRTIFKAKQEEQNKQLEADLEAVRMKQKDKNKISSQLIVPEKFNLSINATDRHMGDQLLGEDFDEEVRMRDRVQEQSLCIETIHDRIDDTDVSNITDKLNQHQSGPNVFKKFNPKLNEILAKQQNETISRKRRDANVRRKIAEESFKTGSNVVMPVYKHDDHMNVDREYNIPPEDLFIGLGYDDDKETKRRHYRRFYPLELENVTEIMPKPSPFNQYDIKRGQTRGAKASFFERMFNKFKTDESGQVSSEQVVGRFKAVIDVEAEEEKQDFLKRKQELIKSLISNLKQLAKNRSITDFDLDLKLLDTMEGRQEIKNMLDPLQVNHLDIVQKLADIESDDILKRMLLQTQKMIVRVYMIEGTNLANRDLFSFSDPYLILKLGDKKYDEQKNYILDEPNPRFLKHYDFEAVFPGCPMLKIDVMDYNDIEQDSLIGSTSVDLEDRYFSPEWRALQNKPVEYRQIYHPQYTCSQGQLKMWVEINPIDCEPKHAAPLYDIRQKPPEEFQMRVCVFETKDIKKMDYEGTSDVFIRAFFDSRKDALETDTHYRCQTGNASFNYRLLYTVEMPRKDYRFTVQAFDKDFFKRNDVIGSSIIDLKQAFQDVQLTKRPLTFNKQYYENSVQKEGDVTYKWEKDGQSFWLPIVAKNEEGVLENNGYVRVQIDITTMEWANRNKIGSARKSPNIEPYLPTPVGRMSFSFNPLKMYRQLIGQELRRKIATYLCIIICSVLCLLILYELIPVVIGNLLTYWIEKGF